MTRVTARSMVTGALLIPVAIALIVVLYSPFDGSAPKLVWGGASDAEGWRGTTVGQSISYGGMNPCVDKGSATVTKIAFDRSNNLEVTGWGSRPNPFEHGGHQLGGEKVTLAQAGFQTGPRRLANLCSRRTIDNSPNNDYEFAVEFRRTGAATGWSFGLMVTYRSGGRSHTSRWPLSYVMCGDTSPVFPSRTMYDLCNTN